MNSKFKDFEFKKKIIIAFCLILMTNAIITSVAYYIFSSRNTINHFQQNSIDMVTQIEIHLGDKFKGITQRVNALSDNLSFANPMRNFLTDKSITEDPVLAGNIAGMISEIKASDDFVDSMYIYTPKAVFDDYLLIRKQDAQFTDTIMYQYMNSHTDKNVAWFYAMENPMYEEAYQNIPVVYRKNVGNREIFFVINISQKAISDYIEQGYSTFEYVFVVDKMGNNILNYSSEYKPIVEAFDESKDTQCSRIEVNGEEYIAAKSIIKENGEQVYALTSVKSMTSSLKQIRTFLIIENVFVIFVCLLVILWLSNRLTSSLKLLAEKMNGAVKSGYHTEFTYPYKDEVGILANSYNSMIAEIRQHIKALEEEKEHVKEIQKQKRKIELLALQAQINPHFLYNTLNMITWQAVDLGADEISIISNALGKYFRISLSRGREVITIREEIEHIKSYLEIQKIRYKTKLNYSINIPEEICLYFTIKLILQPLVENALYHGIKVKEGNGIINIYANADDEKIEIIVEDDGVGIDNDKFELLNSKLKQGIVDSTSGYGIYNVNNRLRLYYGESYGLRLEKADNTGIKSIVTIPVVEREGDINV